MLPVCQYGILRLSGNPAKPNKYTRQTVVGLCRDYPDGWFQGVAYPHSRRHAIECLRLCEKEQGEDMRGIEPHRLTPNERKAVIGVAIFMFLLLVVWVAAIVWMLPTPSQGLI